jgi:hypothetical protein
MLVSMEATNGNPVKHRGVTINGERRLWALLVERDIISFQDMDL